MVDSPRQNPDVACSDPLGHGQGEVHLSSTSSQEFLLDPDQQAHHS